MEVSTGRCRAKTDGRLIAKISHAFNRTAVLLRFVGSRRARTGLCALIFYGALASSSHGSFDTVINVPPDLPIFSGIQSNTQVNVTDGGNVGAYMYLGSSNDVVLWPFLPSVPSNHIELNVYGGTVAYGLEAGSTAGTDSDIVVNLFGGSIGSSFHADGGTAVNIFGGSIGDDFAAGHRTPFWGPPTAGNPAVVDIFGGSIGRSFGVAGTLNMTGGYIGNSFQGATTFNMSGGVVDSWVHVVEGSVANISGGQINYDIGVAGVANISGGTIQTYLGVGNNGVINLSGGAAGESIHSDSGSQLNISGGDYRLNGVPIAGLGNAGNVLGFNIPSGSLLTGTLTDGTPLAITGANVVENGDTIADGTLTLHTTAIPTAAPIAFHSPGGATPRGLHAGQSLTVANGGTIGSGFNASWGSALTITGGQVGDNFEAVGAIVNISGGSIGGLANAFMGSVVNFSGGSIGSNFTVARGSELNMTGGSIGGVFEVQPGGVANVSGGAIEDYFQIYPGSQLKISGGEFRLNGIPISGLQSLGSSRAIDIPSGAVLSGTFSDGTPFAYSDQESDYFAAGTLTLSTTALPASGPTVIQVPYDAAPKGLRTGQSMIVSDGGVVGEKFTAGWGSSVTISGGQVGDSFKAVGSLINISGGSFTGRVHAAYGSLLNISGGSFSGAFEAENGSAVNISGGSLDYIVEAQGGSVVNIAGGKVGGAYFYAYPGSVINVSGGSVGNDLRLYGGTVNMSGGSVGNDFQYGDGVVNLSGGAIGDRFGGGGIVRVMGDNFRLNGTPISGVDADGIDHPFDIPAGSVLSGTLGDGTPFAFSSQDGDTIAAGSLRLQRRYTPPVGPAVIHVPGAAPLGIRAGQTMIVGPGGVVGDNFNAGWGSIVTMTGGEIGMNFETVGAHVTIAGGKVGYNFDAFYGSTVNITGGTVGAFLGAHRGSTVNITGGVVEGSVAVDEGSVVNISGGLGAFRYSDVTAAAGGEVHLFGYGFLLDGVPIAGLIPGAASTITTRDVTLSGTLADGSVFALPLDSWIYSSNYFSPDALLTVTSVLYGDFNGDGIVDMADYAVWRAGLGTVYTKSDYSDWRSHFGQTASGGAGSGAIAAVPEPATHFTMVAVAAAVCCVRRRAISARS